MNDNLSLLVIYKSIFKINKIALRYIYSKAEIDICIAKKLMYCRKICGKASR